MEDAIALVAALEAQPDVTSALAAYETERRPVVELFQRAASESQSYFETLYRYVNLAPLPFAFHLLTRSGRISYDDLRLRDPRFGALVDRAYHGSPALLTAPPPLLTPLRLREVTLPNRVALAVRPACPATNGLPAPAWEAAFVAQARAGAGLIVTPIVAVTADGRITPDDAGLWTATQTAAWARIVAAAHAAGPGRLLVQIGHAGRRGATRPRAGGLDRPLAADGWPLLAASPLPYTPQSPVPQALDRAGMDALRAAFVQAAEGAAQAGCDLLQIHAAHGYLLAGFLSPLTNTRADEYGGNLANRLRFPLEVVTAVRAVWPAGKPLAVALTVTDGVRGGGTVEDAIAVARAFSAAGCDLITVQAGQTTPAGAAPYGRSFLTPLAARIRNEAGIPTLVGGYLTTANEVNTVLAAGRADLCLMEPTKF